MTLVLAQLPFHWAGWASGVQSQKRHPAARLLIAQLTNQSDGFHLSGATFSRERLLDVSFDDPTWVQIADGLRPGQPQEPSEGAEVCFATDGAPDRHSGSASEVSLHWLPYFLADPFRRPR